MGARAWQLNVRFNKLAAKKKTPKLIYTAIDKKFGYPNQKRFNFKSPGKKYFVATSLPMHFDDSTP